MDRRHTQIHEGFIAADLQQMQLAPRYNAWLFELLLPHLGRRILEVGAGVGNMTAELATRADLVVALEPNAACGAELLRKFTDHPQVVCQPGRLDECDIDALRAQRIDTVVCVNVLEHIEDDVGALRTMRQILPAGGTMVLLVPGWPMAYGPIDLAVGHFRRYSKRMLGAALGQVELDVERIRYSNFVGAMGWLFNARVGRITKQSDRQIALFERLVPYLARIEKHLAPPVGLSIVAVARRSA